MTYFCDNIYNILKNGSSQHELIRLLQDSNQLHYELVPVLNSTISDISKIRLEDYFFKSNIDINEYSDEELKTFLYNTEIMVKSNENINVSLTGMLFFAKKIGFWLKNSGVQLVRFNGNDVTDKIIDRKDLEGNKTAY